MTPADKYPSIFLSQMEAIMFIIFQIFFATHHSGILLGYSPVLAGKYSITWPIQMNIVSNGQHPLWDMPSLRESWTKLIVVKINSHSKKMNTTSQFPAGMSQLGIGYSSPSLKSHLMLWPFKKNCFLMVQPKFQHSSPCCLLPGF